MKLAYIDTQYSSSELIKEELEENGVQVDYSSGLKEFLDEHGDFRDYDGLLIHLGYKKQGNVVEISTNNPQLPVVITTWGDLVEYYGKGEIPIIGRENVPEIIKYFQLRLEEKV